MDPTKVKGVADWPPPKNPTEIRRFLGFTGYYRYFVPNYSKIARPLLDLTKKTTPWHWGKDQHRAFEELKTRMCCGPVLTQPNFSKRFYLQTDASAYGVGAILSQEGENPNTSPRSLLNPTRRLKPKLHPIAYYSATFTPTERNYDIYERELLAVMKSLAHWRPYLGWTKEPFIILTDHANLQYWKSPRDLNRRTARWHADLQEYDYEIQHIPGKTNVVADALSRPTGVDQGEEDNKNVTIIPPERFKIATTQSVNQRSEEQKRHLMKTVHDHPTAGHPGRDETIRKAKQIASWPGMNAWITNYVKGCATCQQNKIITHKSKTPSYQITTQEDALPFQQIAMDLITGLPMNRGKDAILTIVDHGCSRAAIFLPCNTTITGEGIAQLYFDHVYRWFGLPTKIISDRDPRFTSHFGRALTKKLGITQNLSSAFHPQTDGISERKNQWVEQYLRIVTSTSPEDWTQWLTIASAVHNNRKNATTNLSPNEILLGYEITIAPQETPPSNNAAAQHRTDLLHQKRKQAIQAINRAINDKTIPSQFKIKDQVWLEATNLKLRHQKTKLAPKRYGPFRVIKEISPVAYQIQLPPSWNIHDVFHASLLRPYHETAAHGPNFSRPPPDLINGEEEYEVERIVNHRRHGRSRTLQYLIKWKGYPESDNTWEPASQVHAPDLIKSYQKSNALEIRSYLLQSAQKDIKTTTARHKKTNPRSDESPLVNQSTLLPTLLQNLSLYQANPFAFSSSSIKTKSPNLTPTNTPSSADSHLVHTTTLTAKTCLITPETRPMKAPAMFPEAPRTTPSPACISTTIPLYPLGQPKPPWPTTLDPTPRQPLWHMGYWRPLHEETSNTKSISVVKTPSSCKKKTNSDRKTLPSPTWRSASKPSEIDTSPQKPHQTVTDPTVRDWPPISSFQYKMGTVNQRGGLRNYPMDKWPPSPKNTNPNNLPSFQKYMQPHPSPPTTTTTTICTTRWARSRSGCNNSSEVLQRCSPSYPSLSREKGIGECKQKWQGIAPSSAASKITKSVLPRCRPSWPPLNKPRTSPKRGWRRPNWTKWLVSYDTSGGGKEVVQDLELR